MNCLQVLKPAVKDWLVKYLSNYSAIHNNYLLYPVFIIPGLLALYITAQL